MNSSQITPISKDQDYSLKIQQEDSTRVLMKGNPGHNDSTVELKQAITDDDLKGMMQISDEKVGEQDIDKLAFNLIPDFYEDFKTAIMVEDDNGNDSKEKKISKKQMNEGKKGILDIDEFKEYAEKIYNIDEKSGPTQYLTFKDLYVRGSTLNFQNVPEDVEAEFVILLTSEKNYEKGSTHYYIQRVIKEEFYFNTGSYEQIELPALNNPLDLTQVHQKNSYSKSSLIYFSDENLTDLAVFDTKTNKVIVIDRFCYRLKKQYTDFKKGLPQKTGSKPIPEETKSKELTGGDNPEVSTRQNSMLDEVDFPLDNQIVKILQAKGNQAIIVVINSEKYFDKELSNNQEINITIDFDLEQSFFKVVHQNARAKKYCKDQAFSEAFHPTYITSDIVAYSVKFLDIKEEVDEENQEENTDNDDEEDNEKYYIYFNFMKITSDDKKEQPIQKLVEASLDATQIYNQEEGSDIDVQKDRFASPDGYPDICSIGDHMFSLSLDSRRPFKIKAQSKKEKFAYVIEPIGEWVEHKERQDFILFVPEEILKEEEGEVEYEYYKQNVIFTHKNHWITSAPREEMKNVFQISWDGEKNQHMLNTDKEYLKFHGNVGIDCRSNVVTMTDKDLGKVQIYLNTTTLGYTHCRSEYFDKSERLIVSKVRKDGQLFVLSALKSKKTDIYTYHLYMYDEMRFWKCQKFDFKFKPRHNEVAKKLQEQAKQEQDMAQDVGGHQLRKYLKEETEKIIDMVFGPNQNMIFLFSSTGGIYLLDLMLDNTSYLEPIYDFQQANYRLEFSIDHKWALAKKRIDQNKKKKLHKRDQKSMYANVPTKISEQTDTTNMQSISSDKHESVQRAQTIQLYKYYLIRLDQKNMETFELQDIAKNNWNPFEQDEYSYNADFFSVQFSQIIEHGNAQLIIQLDGKVITVELDKDMTQESLEAQASMKLESSEPFVSPFFYDKPDLKIGQEKFSYRIGPFVHRQHPLKEQLDETEPQEKDSILALVRVQGKAFIIDTNFKFQQNFVEAKINPKTFIRFLNNSQNGRMMIYEFDDVSKKTRLHDIETLKIFTLKQREVDLFAGYLRIQSLADRSSFLMECYRFELEGKLSIPFLQHLQLKIEKKRKKSSKNYYLRKPSTSLLGFYKDYDQAYDMETFKNKVSALKPEELVTQYSVFGGKNSFHIFTASNEHFEYMISLDKEYDFALLNDDENNNPLDICIDSQNLELTQIILTFIQQNSGEMSLSDILRGNFKSLIDAQADMVDILRSPLAFEKLQYDILPANGKNVKEVLIIDGDMFHELFKIHYNVKQIKGKSMNKFKKHDTFQSTYLEKMSVKLKANGPQNEKVSCQHFGTTDPELESTKFIEAILENGNPEYLDLPFIKYLKESEWLQYRWERNVELMMHMLLILLLSYNIVYIHVVADEQDEDLSRFMYFIPDGRQNIRLFASKIAASALLVYSTCQEIIQLKGLGYDRYFKSMYNYLDIAMIVLFILTFYYDTDEVATDGCKGLYQVLIVIVIIVFTKHLRLIREISFIMQMIFTSIHDLLYFILLFLLFLYMFTLVLYLQGIVPEQSYDQVQAWSYLFMYILAMREGMGDFDAVKDDELSLTKLQKTLYKITQFFMIIIMLIMFTNFLIASVSDTYEMVLELKDSTFSTQQLIYLLEKRHIAENKTPPQPKVILARVPIEIKKESDEWRGYLYKMQKLVSSIRLKLRDQIRKFSQQTKRDIKDLAKKVQSIEHAQHLFDEKQTEMLNLIQMIAEKQGIDEKFQNEFLEAKEKNDKKD